ncbi:hypothetical protein SAMN04488100_11315 [Alkalibacterium putridalgicola]|uniref:Outer membrane lipoprotein-sorting protein n=1 Tax=Alkalibacterium putridalgicola TaxID=426703 RepID=A0A1H7TM05_9LACT|nr:DUF6544 family protein [Alkalibacterium putridalgicola]GEK88222.1 hypothetical protein APU01nite_02610 [Alkalibacterium putridalgicola]SEL85529.1 hypothetical protein SAMN04488100_11315 [Alkalibacterium putridalgicola]
MSLTKRLVISLLVLSGVGLSGSLLAQTHFKRNVKAEVEELFSTVENEGERISEEDLKGLPENVQRWFKYSGMIGKKSVVSVRLRQQAEMRLGPDSRWMPVEAEQYFTSVEPGFIWDATIKAAPFIHISGRDKYQNGRGSMLIKPLSLFTLADSQGQEIDQGTLLRYLAETMWFPSALLNDYIEWKEIDSHKAKAVMTYKGVSASGIFTINDKGEVTRFEAERYGDFDGEFRMETWSIPVSTYKSFEGINVPTKGEITWKLDEGDYNWFNFEVMDIEYNNPHVY